MRYVAIAYVDPCLPDLLDLNSFDGTRRRIRFRSAADKAGALVAGRAEADVTGIEHGLLPRGATLVSPAIPLDAKTVLTATNADRQDPLAEIRLMFSQRLLIERSQEITEISDAFARKARPDQARRYDMMVDGIETAHREGRFF